MSLTVYNVVQGVYHEGYSVDSTYHKWDDAVARAREIVKSDFRSDEWVEESEGSFRLDHYMYVCVERVAVR